MKTQKEILTELKAGGILITRNTFYNWINWGIIPEQSKYIPGKASLYPDDTVCQATASYELIHNDKFKADPAEVAKVREIALYLKKTFYENKSEMNKDEKLINMVKGEALRAFLAIEWLNIYFRCPGNVLEKEELKGLISYFLREVVSNVITLTGEISEINFEDPNN
jgi:hypothetical protein